MASHSSHKAHDREKIETYPFCNVLWRGTIKTHKGEHTITHHVIWIEHHRERVTAYRDIETHEDYDTPSRRALAKHDHQYGDPRVHFPTTEEARELDNAWWAEQLQRNAPSTTDTVH